MTKKGRVVVFNRCMLRKFRSWRQAKAGFLWRTKCTLTVKVNKNQKLKKISRTAHTSKCCREFVEFCFLFFYMCFNQLVL